MSAETKAALDTAIQAHFADAWENDGYLTGYVLQMSGVTIEDMTAGEQTSYFREVAEGQAAHVTLGLIDYSHTMFRQALGQTDDD